MNQTHGSVFPSAWLDYYFRVTVQTYHTEGFFLPRGWFFPSVRKDTVVYEVDFTVLGRGGPLLWFGLSILFQAIPGCIG